MLLMREKWLKSKRLRTRLMPKTVAKIMEAISPDLIQAITVGGQAELTQTLAKHMSPYALANGESIVETTQKLLNGLPFDVKQIMAGLNEG